MRALLAAWTPALCGLVLPLAGGAVTPCTGDLATYRWTQRPLEPLLELIDGMPMRQREVQSLGALPP